MLVDPDPETDQSNPSSGKSEQSSLYVGAVVFVIVGVGLGMYWLSAGRMGGYATPAATQRIPTLVRSGNHVTVPDGSPIRAKLTIVSIAANDFRRDLVLPAAVEADPAHLIKVSPPVAGLVTQLKVELGERVKAGQSLVVIDSPDLGTAYSDYDKAKVLLALALKNRDRQRGLQKIGGAAEKDLLQAETDYVTAEAEYQRATAHLKQIGVNAEAADKSRTVTVAAPMDGSIIDLSVAPGQYWNDPTAALMTVADLKIIWVTASVPESDTALVSKGQLADVAFAAYPGEIYHGQVLFVSDVVDPDTRRTKVRIAFDNSNARLRPGMFATVSFHAPNQRVPVVPASALVIKDDVSQVFVETAPWTFEARNVDIAFQQGDEAALATGVSPGERVVIKGGVLLSD